jgi:hypothetical protein
MRKERLRVEAREGTSPLPRFDAERSLPPPHRWGGGQGVRFLRYRGWTPGRKELELALLLERFDESASLRDLAFSEDGEPE